MKPEDPCRSKTQVRQDPCILLFVCDYTFFLLPLNMEQARPLFSSHLCTNYSCGARM